MAKRTISQLNIEVTSSSRGLKKGVNEANRGLSGLASKAALAAAAIAAAFTATLAVAKKVVSAVNNIAASFDEVIKSARFLRVEVEDLEGLKLLGEFGGGDANRVVQALTFFNDALADAAKGSGEAADAFSKMGLDPLAVAAMDTVDALKLVGESLKDLSTAERIDIAKSLFGGRTGPQFLNMLDSIKGSFDDVALLVDRLGLALTKVQRDGIEKLVDSNAVLSASFKGLQRNLAADVAPELTKLNLQLAEFVAQMTAASEVVKTLGTALVAVSGPIVALGDALQRFPSLGNNIGRVRKELEGGGGGNTIPELMDRIWNNVTTKVPKAREEIDHLTDSVDAMTLSLSSGFGSFETMESLAARIADSFGEVDSSVRSAVSGATAAADVRTQAGMSQLNEAIRAARRDEEKARKMHDERVKADDRRDKILKELERLMELFHRRPSVRVTESEIVG